MASIEQLRELAERLGKATGTDMELDGAIFHLYPTLAGVRGYTSSVDAALALVARLLPGWEFSLSNRVKPRVEWQLELHEPGLTFNSYHSTAYAPTAALAILRALVASLIAQAEVP